MHDALVLFTDIWSTLTNIPGRRKFYLAFYWTRWLYWLYWLIVLWIEAGDATVYWSYWKMIIFERVMLLGSGEMELMLEMLPLICAEVFVQMNL